MPDSSSRPVTHLDSPEDSLEAHLTRHSRRAESIYVTSLGLILLGLALLPVVRVSVAVQAFGLIRPTTERHEIPAPTQGIVEFTSLRQGRSVDRGDELLRIGSATLELRAELLRARIAEEQRALSDLRRLLASDGTLTVDSLSTATHQEDFRRYTAELRQARSELEYARVESDRMGELAVRGLIPTRDSEQATLRLAGARSAVAQLERGYRARWAEALSSTRQRLRDLRAERAALEEELSLLHVRAPVDGTLEEVASLSVGSYVRAGEVVAVISPVAPLVAEVLVDPRDVGLLGPGSPARILIDAFDYRDWGVLTGRIRSISKDYVLVDDRPVFRAEIALDATALRLENGAVGRLRKGMSLRARFTVAERTLWQLLRDDLDAWFSPYRTPTSPSRSR